MPTFAEAKELIEKELAKKFDVGETVYPSDITEMLNLDYNLAFDVFIELKKEGKLE